MISFFKKSSNYFFAVEHSKKLVKDDIKILSWLFGNASYSKDSILKGNYIGPVKEMTTPWSTNAVEITKNVGINYIERIEILEKNKNSFDPMTESKYLDPGQEIFKVTKKAEKVLFVDNLDHYNKNEGLALSDDEIDYLNQVSKRLNRKLTDSEVFGFSQVNSEHCRHKIFNGEFILDGKKMDNSLFQMIKKTSKENPSNIISAYKDNVAFITGPDIELFTTDKKDTPDYYKLRKIKSSISLKAETHNFPTTVEPFSGAATGSGGEIRDRVGSPTGRLLMFISPPVSSNSSERQLRCPPAP